MSNYYIRGYSGITGYSGLSGYSGMTGYSGFSGFSGMSGVSGVCWSEFDETFKHMDKMMDTMSDGMDTMSEHMDKIFDKKAFRKEDDDILDRIKTSAKYDIYNSAEGTLIKLRGFKFPRIKIPKKLYLLLIPILAGAITLIFLNMFEHWVK